jgi:DNA-binding PadR family transcriptional regulator
MHAHQNWDMSWRMKLGQRGWLRPTVFRVLEEGPMNGIEIMGRIQEMSNGWWRPSPGSIYPLLETLVGEKLLSKRDDGKYELTDTYKEAYGPSGEPDEILTSMEGDTSYLEELARSDKDAFSKYRARIARIGERLSHL